MLTDSATKTAGRKFALLQCVLQPGLYQTRTKEHKVDMYENLARSKLDEDVKISVVMREVSGQRARELTAVRNKLEAASSQPSVPEHKQRVDCR